MKKIFVILAIAMVLVSITTVYLSASVMGDIIWCAAVAVNNAFIDNDECRWSVFEWCMGWGIWA